MPACCWCNGSGTCVNCQCRKGGRRCQACRPMRQNRCQNAPDQLLDNARELAPHSLVFVGDRGETSQLHEELCQDDDETEPGKNHANPLDSEETLTLSDTDSHVSQLGARDRVSNNSLGIGLDHPVMCHVQIPPPSVACQPNFRWGEKDGTTFTALLDKAYEQTVHWRRNVFELPRWKMGSAFIRELSRLIEAYNDDTALEKIAMKAVVVMPALLLQKPHPRSKVKDHIRVLEDRLMKWRKGDLESLLHESQTVQSRLEVNQHQHQDRGKTGRSFEKLVAMGNVKAAVRLITEHGDRGCLPLDGIQPDGRTVMQHLIDKHPPGQPADPSTISDCPPTRTPHPIIYEEIDGTPIKSIVQRMDGAAGPSGLNAADWKRMCFSFHRQSDDLCRVIAGLTKKLCSTYVDPHGISSLVACRLIALDKSPGVRPVGIGETLRQLVSKAVLWVVQEYIQAAVGCHQLCTGQEAAREAGVYAMRTLLEDENVEAVLLVDGANFNSLNREAALLNVHVLCPTIAPILTNTYRNPARLFIGEQYITSCKGTMQGDPLAMAMYALATLPLILQLGWEVTQSWYADDASAGGRLGALWRWWDKLWISVKCKQDVFDCEAGSLESSGIAFPRAALGDRSFVANLSNLA